MSLKKGKEEHDVPKLLTWKCKLVLDIKENLTVEIFLSRKLNNK